MFSSIKRYLSIAFFLLIAIASQAQENTITRSIYFSTDKFDLRTESKQVLDALLDSLKNYQYYEIRISGNTDNVGSLAYNDNLSKQRVQSTKNYLSLKGIDNSRFNTSAYGEKKPIASNENADGKQQNRRVDIQIIYKDKPCGTLPDTSNIDDLYKQLERKPNEYCINPKRDTLLRCEQGTLISIKANTFSLPANCTSGCVTLKVKENYLKSDMILDRLTTMSNERPLETEGMVYTDAVDCNDNKLSPSKDLVFFIPTDSVRKDAKLFDGSRLHNGDMNWTLNNNPELNNISLAQMESCYNGKFTRDRVLCEECRFFNCRINRFSLGMKGISDKKQHLENKQFRNCQRQIRSDRRNGIKRGGSNLPDSLQASCTRINELYKKYGVNNPQALILAMNKPLLDSFGVTTMEQLRDTLNKLRIQKFEESFEAGALTFNDMKYYVFNTKKTGWYNVDCFSSYQGPKVSLTINLKRDSEVDCKLVFKDRASILSDYGATENYEFPNIPKGERIWVMALKYVDGRAFLCLKETTTSNTPVDVEFKQYSLDELKEQLKILDL